MNARYRKRACRSILNKKKAIRYLCDYESPWEKHIPTLRRFNIKQVNFLSITGDAPKDFISDREYRPGHRGRRQRLERYIAKVGSKWYPMESITEHLITRIGQIYGLKIADSKLRIVHGQVRFMSKYFLRRQSEQLTHGAEMFEVILGKEDYATLTERRREREFFTFQMVEEAVAHSFPDQTEKIMRSFVQMLTFDGLIGHNDRHAYNWGVIVPLRKDKPPRFSPVYDSARALFWNVPEERVKQMLKDHIQFTSYIARCSPQLGWDKIAKVDFFHLLGLVSQYYRKYSQGVKKFVSEVSLQNTCKMIDDEFGDLMSVERRELIKKCLHQRQHFLRDAFEVFGEEEAERSCQ